MTFLNLVLSFVLLNILIIGKENMMMPFEKGSHTQKLSNFREEPTLHKVWVFKEIKPVKNSVCTMCGMTKITMIDFTKEDTLKFMANDSLKRGPYQRVKDIIVLNQQESPYPLTFRIDKLTKNILELIVVIDYTNGETKLKGDMIKLVFEEKKK